MKPSSVDLGRAKRWDIGGWLAVGLVVLCLFVAWRSIQPGAATGGADLVPWRLDHSQAFLDARKQDTPAFVYFTADWCPPCRAMKAQVYNQPQVARLLGSRAIPIKVDMTAPTPGGPEHRLALRFRAQYLPTMLIVSPAGDVTDAYYGPPDVREFMAWLQRALPQRATATEGDAPAT